MVVNGITFSSQIVQALMHEAWFCCSRGILPSFFLGEKSPSLIQQLDIAKRIDGSLAAIIRRDMTEQSFLHERVCTEDETCLHHVWGLKVFLSEVWLGYDAHNPFFEKFGCVFLVYPTCISAWIFMVVPLEFQVRRLHKWQFLHQLLGRSPCRIATVSGKLEALQIVSISPSSGWYLCHTNVLSLFFDSIKNS